MSPRNFRLLASIILLATNFSVLTVEAEEKNPPCLENVTYLETDKPISIGYRTDSKDVAHADINLSLQTPILYQHFVNWFGCEGHWLPYFSVNIEEGFYVPDTRPSQPVVGKTFNPTYMRVRRFISGSTIGDKDSGDAQYLDFEYGHLSNGQNVTHPQQFKDLANSQDDGSRNDRDAQDYISRSWDYLRIDVHKVFKDQNYASSTFTGSITYYGVAGPGGLEEYNKCLGINSGSDSCNKDALDSSSNSDVGSVSGEGPRKFKKLNQVDGLAFSWIKFFDNNFVSGVGLTYKTGLENPLVANTYRADVLILPLLTSVNNKYIGVNLDLWASTGYDSDPVHYYERINSIGLALFYETGRSNKPSAAISSENESSKKVGPGPASLGRLPSL